MLKYMENLYEVSVKRKNACRTKDNVMYVKWAFPIARGGLNPTYTDKINKTTLKNILTETQDYRTSLISSLENLHKKYPTELKFVEKAIVYGLEQKTPFATTKRLTFQTVKTKEDLRLWGRIASKIYDSWDTDSIYESFKTDLGKKYATYFIFYKGKTPVGVSQVIRGGGYSAVYWIGVIEKHRKQGFGREITAQTLNHEITNKRTKFLLTASKLGLIIYKKLGFKPMETIYEYELKKHL